MCVWRPIDEIKQFLGLLENYYKRIIKRGAKVESKLGRCLCGLRIINGSAPPLHLRLYAPASVSQAICKPPQLTHFPPLPGNIPVRTCKGLVTPAPAPAAASGRDRLRAWAWAWATIGILSLAFRSHTQTHIKRVRQTRLSHTPLQERERERARRERECESEREATSRRSR